MASQTEVDLIVKAISSGFDKVAKDLKGVGDSSSSASTETQKAGMSFTEMANQLQVAEQAASVFFGTFQQAFEIGRAGEQVRQTSASFDTLTASVGVSNGLLDELKIASRGTVDDMTLMSATSTLLAGTQGALATALASATPELMSMAKAAQKLNPSLGDTTYMYESLALGIKRASPMILDNLGITVKLSEAYEVYARSIGKSADQLSAEEQKIALLNGVLAQGDILMRQAGGTNASYTDSIDRMNVAIKNASDAIKAKFAPSLSDAAGAVYNLMEGTNNVNTALEQHEQKMANTAKTYDEYTAEVKRSLEANLQSIDTETESAKVFDGKGHILENVTGRFDLLTRGEFEAIKATKEFSTNGMEMGNTLAFMAETAENTAESVSEAAEMTDEYAAYLGGFTEQAANATHQMELMSEIQTQLAITTAGLAAGLAGDVQDAMLEYSETMTDLVTEADQLNAELADATTQYGANSTQVAELTAKLQENETEQLKAGEAMQKATAEMIYQQAAAGLDAQASLELARSLGLISEQDYAIATAVGELRAAYDANKNGAIEAGEAAAGFTADVKLMYDAISSLQKSNSEITFENIAKEMERLQQATEGNTASEELDQVGQAASDVADTATAADELAGAADDAASATSDAGSGTEKLALAMSKAGTSAPGAVTGVNNFANALRSAQGPISDTSGQIKDIGDALRGIPSNTQIRFSASGGAEVRQLLLDIKNGIAELPSEKTITITVNADEGGGGAAESNLMGGAGGVSITNNIYDAAAAALVTSEQNKLIRSRAASLM